MTFELIEPTWSQDSIGQWVEQQKTRKVYGQIASINSTEFFAAGQNGISPEFRITMFGPDYQGEQDLVLDGEIYSIYRTYQTRNDMLELYVEKRRGDGDRRFS